MRASTGRSRPDTTGSVHGTPRGREHGGSGRSGSAAGRVRVAGRGERGERETGQRGDRASHVWSQGNTRRPAGRARLNFGAGAVTVVADPPEKADATRAGTFISPTEAALTSRAREVRREVVIISPYLVPGPDGLATLLDLRPGTTYTVSVVARIGRGTTTAAPVVLTTQPDPNAVAQQIVHVAGTAIPDAPMPASDAPLLNATGLAEDTAGNVYVSAGSAIWRIAPDGSAEVIAGAGSAGNATNGFAGDGGPARNAKFDTPRGLAWRNGVLYVADRANNRVRAIAADGTISTVAGNGTTTWAGEGAMVTATGLNGPNDLGFDGSGRLLITLGAGNRVARLTFLDGVRIDRLDIAVEMAVDIRPVNPFDFFLDDRAQTTPFAYPAEMRHDLLPFFAVDDPAMQGGPLLDAFLAELPSEGPTVPLIIECNRLVNERTRYVIREEAGIWTPEQTLAEGRGSCRDSAVLLIAQPHWLSSASR